MVYDAGVVIEDIGTEKPDANTHPVFLSTIRGDSLTSIAKYAKIIWTDFY